MRRALVGIAVYMAGVSAVLAALLMLNGTDTAAAILAAVCATGCMSAATFLRAELERPRFRLPKLPAPVMPMPSWLKTHASEWREREIAEAEARRADAVIEACDELTETWINLDTDDWDKSRAHRLEQLAFTLRMYLAGEDDKLRGYK